MDMRICINIFLCMKHLRTNVGVNSWWMLTLIISSCRSRILWWGGEEKKNKKESARHHCQYISLDTLRHLVFTRFYIGVV